MKKVHAFGSPKNLRQFNLTSVRVGFNGQEKDDEISGSGNVMSAENWEYDTRLGRRWNIDPVIKSWESPYATFNNSPVVYADPKGLDGIATVDKEKKTVNIKMDIHYSKENIDNKDYGKNGIASYGETIDKMKTTLTDTYSKIDKVKVSGEDYTVSFEFNFIEHPTDQARDEAVKNNPASNALKYRGDENTDKPGLGGYWKDGERSLTLLLGRGNGTKAHEIGHALGLDHAKGDPNDPFFLRENNGLGETCDGAGLMSYANNASLQEYEVQIIVQRAVNTAKTVNDNNVKVHLTGVAGEGLLNRESKVIK